MDLRRVRPEEWLVGAFGALLLVSLFLDWYGFGPAGSRTCWEEFSVLDIGLAVVGVASVAVAVIAAWHRTQAVALMMVALLVPLVLVALGFVVYRTLSVPSVAGGGSGTREVGLWLALVATVGLAAASLRSLRSDRFPAAVQESQRVEVEKLPTPPREGAGEASS